jgi:hypothetical protein
MPRILTNRFAGGTGMSIANDEGEVSILSCHKKVAIATLNWRQNWQFFQAIKSAMRSQKLNIAFRRTAQRVIMREMRIPFSSCRELVYVEPTSTSSRSNPDEHRCNAVEHGGGVDAPIAGGAWL